MRDNINDLQQVENVILNLRSITESGGKILLVRSQSKILQQNKVIELAARSHNKILQQNYKQDLVC